MRIAIVAGPMVPVPPLKYGGTEQVVYYLIKGLQEAGHEPILFGPGDSTINCEIVPIVDKAIFFPKTKKEMPAHIRRMKQIHQRTKRLLRERRNDYDIIHSHGFDLLSFYDVPNLTTIHNNLDFNDLPHYLARQNLYFASISKNQQESCPDLLYVGAVYNGEDPKEFPIIEEPDDYVCFLGRMDPEKIPHLAIELAINLGMPIKVAGKTDHNSEGYFQEKVEPLLSHPLVEYLGELDFEQKVQLLSRARCNLHPTGFREPFGLTVLEAAYCGTPTLAIARGSMLELIEEGRTGLLVEDFVEGYHHVQQCFDMNRRYIAERSRLLFNYETMTQQYLKAYQEVLDIFKTREKQNQIIKEMRSNSQLAIERIWDATAQELFVKQ